MCYAGGPYCDKPAQNRLTRAQNAFADNPSDENKVALANAREDFLTSSAGIKSLRAEGKTEEAARYARKRENGIARGEEEKQAKALANPKADPNMLHRAAINGHYHAKVVVANNPNLSMRTLKHIVENEEEDDFRFAIARHPKATPEMVAWAAKHHSYRAKDLALDNPNISQKTIREIRSQAMKDYQEASDAAGTVSPDQQYQQWKVRETGAVWRKASKLLSNSPSHINRTENAEAAKNVIPRDGEYKDYYAATDAKHFGGADNPGSQFTDRSVKNLNAIVALANHQRGSLEGDDRETLIKYGADPASFSPNHRYLMVRASGNLGATKITDLPANSKLSIERTKPGAPCSVVADVESKPTVNFGVVIMGKMDKTSDKESVVTAHPGFPSKPSTDDRFDAYEGRKLSINHVMEIAGYDNVAVNTRVKK